MKTIVKGMVQVNSITYRIAREGAGQYKIIRLLDDAFVGQFSPGSVCDGAVPELIREIARAALQGGRTSWLPSTRISSGSLPATKV